MNNIDPKDANTLREASARIINIVDGLVELAKTKRLPAIEALNLIDGFIDIANRSIEYNTPTVKLLLQPHMQLLIDARDTIIAIKAPPRPSVITQTMKAAKPLPLADDNIPFDLQPKLIVDNSLLEDIHERPTLPMIERLSPAVLDILREIDE